MILITSLGEFPFIILQSFFLSFISLLKKKKKKNSAAGSLLFLCCPIFTFVAGIHFQWIKNSKASSSGSVGKLTERKWNPHMKSNTVNTPWRVTLVHICP